MTDDLPSGDLTDPALNDLLAELGTHLSAGAAGVPFGARVVLARAWVRSHLDELQSAVCSSEAVARARKVGDSNDAALLVAIGDVISPLVGALPVATVGLLLVRYGIDDLCPVS